MLLRNANKHKHSWIVEQKWKYLTIMPLPKIKMIYILLHTSMFILIISIFAAMIVNIFEKLKSEVFKPLTLCFSTLYF